MPSRKRLSSSFRRFVPVDDLVLCLLAVGLWAQWPSSPSPKSAAPARRPALRAPFAAFAQTESNPRLRALLSEASPLVFHERRGGDHRTALPGWADATASIPRPEPTALATPVPPVTPLQLPLPPEPPSASGDAPPADLLPPPRPVAPDWTLAAPDDFAEAGVRLDEAALRAASREAAPDGECAADIVVGENGFPQSVLLDPEMAAVFSADVRTSLFRALLRTRGPARGRRVAGRVLWRWRPEPAPNAPPAGDPEPSP